MQTAGEGDPLLLACQNGHQNIVQMLLNKLAEVNIIDEKVYTT